MRRPWPTGGCRTNTKKKIRAAKIFLEISEAVYFVKKLPTFFYTGQGFISVHTGDPKLGPVSEINSVNNIKLY
jgi:hypothetical protein